MRVHINRDRGSVLVQVVVAMAVLFGFMALTTDYGLMAVRQRKLQSATDAAALAAGPEMHTPNSEAAVRMAIRYAGENSAGARSLEFDWVGPRQLRITAWDEVPTPFLGVLDSRRTTRQVSAVSEIQAVLPMSINTTSKVRPWGIPIAFFNPGGESPIRFDEDVQLHLVENADEQPEGVPDGSYFIQPFALSQGRRDPANGDFPNYTHDVKFGYDQPISVTKKKSEPGYLDSFMWSQPGRWNEILNATYQALISDRDSLLKRAIHDPRFRDDTPENFSADNPRLVFLPIYDRAIFGGSETRAKILGFTAFYVEGMSGNPLESMSGNIITGRFVRHALPYDGHTLNPVNVEQMNTGLIQFRLVK